MYGSLSVEPSDRPHADDVRERGFAQLCRDVETQEARFLRGLPSTDAPARELFRRAIDQHDEIAWATILELYRPLLLAHSRRLLVRGLVREDDQFCVERAFERFWQATRTSGLAQFADLAAILKYLKLCLASVLLDEARARRRQPTLPLDDVAPDARLSDDPATLATDNGAGHELWHAVLAELRSPKEHLVARHSFLHGHTPRDIFHLHPSRFRDVAEIYRIKRNVLERLRHSAAIQALRN